MRTLFLAVLFAFLPAADLHGQSTARTASAWELALHGSWSWNSRVSLDLHHLDVVGLQLEHAVHEHVVPWGSVRRNEVYDGCPFLGGTECVTGGWSLYTGLNLRAGEWGGLLPYVSLGAGLLRWNSGEIEGMWAIRPGLSYVSFGRIRPRVELGYERHLDVGLTFGIGLAI